MRRTKSYISSNSSLSTSVRLPLPRETEKAKMKEKERQTRQNKSIDMQTGHTNKLCSTTSTSLSLLTP